MAQHCTALIPQADAGNAIQRRATGLRGSALPGFVPTALCLLLGAGGAVTAGVGNQAINEVMAKRSMSFGFGFKQQT